MEPLENIPTPLPRDREPVRGIQTPLRRKPTSEVTTARLAHEVDLIYVAASKLGVVRDSLPGKRAVLDSLATLAEGLRGPER